MADRTVTPLPCPFCGANPKVETILKQTHLFCNQMACPLNVGTVHYGSVDGAISAWNRRAAPARPVPEGKP